MIERFFRSISTDRLESGVFRSVPELIAAIEDDVTTHHQNPKPFFWTATTSDVLQKVVRATRRLGSENNQALHGISAREVIHKLAVIGLDERGTPRRNYMVPGGWPRESTSTTIATNFREQLIRPSPSDRGIRLLANPSWKY